jgi:hypothetical protein
LPIDSYEDFVEELKNSNDIVTKIDQILIDLRKYGFTLLTGLTTAGAFLGFSSPLPFLQLSVIFATMILVAVLYWLDIYYQGILSAAVLCSQVLEYKLHRRLSTYISNFYMLHKIGGVLHFLYGGFLVGLIFLALFVLSSMANTQFTVFATILILIGALFPLVLLVVIYFAFDRGRFDVYIKIAKHILEYSSDNTQGPPPHDLEKEIMQYFWSECKNKWGRGKALE